jgi:hypothetical protein
MSDIISAKCFACGHIVKVPSALGGKKARCPKCTNTIAIPAMSETQDDIVTDDQLPEVAKEGEILEGEEILEEDQEAAGPPARPETKRERGSSASHRRPPAGREGGASGRGGGRAGGRGATGVRKKSNTGLIVGIIIAVSVILAIAVGASMKGGDGRKGGPRAPGGDGSKDGTKAPSPPPSIGTGAEDQALETRCREFLSTWNRGSIAEAARFYDPDPSPAIKQKVGSLMQEGVQYKRAEFKIVSASSQLTTFLCEYQSNSEAAKAKEVSLKWKQVDGVWYIADPP